MILPMLCAMVAGAPAPQPTVSVLAHGARGDGKTDNTQAINRAIDACRKGGGGEVVVPPGLYLTGTVRLASGVTLRLMAGATIRGVEDLSAYAHYDPPKEAPESAYGRWFYALVLGVGVHDAAIVGEGTIDGGKVFDRAGEEGMRGPHAMVLGDCSNITVRGIQVRDAANYGMMIEGSDRIQVSDVTFEGGWDGVHFRGWPGRPCRHVTISNCRFYTGDDSIAGRYWEDTLITGCTINSSCNGIRLIGPATRLVVSNCTFSGPGREPHRTSNRHNMLAAVNLQPGGWDKTEGALEDVTLTNLTMSHVATPFHIALRKGNTAGRITISHVTATDAYEAAATVESWAETPFGEVTLRDVSFSFAGGRTPATAPRTVEAPGTDARPLPCWGLHARGVKTLRLEDVRLSADKPDTCPVIRCEDVGILRLEGVTYPLFAGAAPPLDLVRVGTVETREIRRLGGS